MQSLYFHGLPGGSAELELVQAQRPFCVFRDTDPAAMAKRIRELFPNEELHFIGFSLGAAYVLQLAKHLTPARLDLIAPAVPLTLGDFLPRMAGKPVFQAARRPALLALMTNVQSWLLRLVPRFFLRVLFSTAPVTEHRLLANDTFRGHLQQAMQQSLGPGRRAYLREVAAYIVWHDLPETTCPVTIWQGTGDTWVPQEMAMALAEKMPGSVLRLLPDLGHYGALQYALPQIMAGLDLTSGTTDNRGRKT